MLGKWRIPSPVIVHLHLGYGESRQSLNSSGAIFQTMYFWWNPRNPAHHQIHTLNLNSVWTLKQVSGAYNVKWAYRAISQNSVQEPPSACWSEQGTWNMWDPFSYLALIISRAKDLHEEAGQTNNCKKTFEVSGVASINMILNFLCFGLWHVLKPEQFNRQFICCLTWFLKTDLEN